MVGKATVNGKAGSKNLVLVAMIFAVAMTFIDQTIVSIAVPQIQKELHLTSTGVQWVVNAYLLSLAALFAFGGRLADMVGHRRMVIIGVVVFVFASVMCGLTPANSAAEAWIIAWRVVQGAGGALMYPAALALVVNAFPLRERGRAMAVFFGVAGGLTAIGPILGGYLSEWTWRAIFWVNVPVALVALILIFVSRPVSETRPGRLDYRGLVMICGGVALSVLGLQQSAIWGWSNPATWLCIFFGAVLLVVFALVELRTPEPLIRVQIFANRAFSVENAVLLISMMVFIPICFFASEYAQIALGDSAQEAGLYLLVFFAGFAPGAQIGGRILDRRGAKPAVVAGCTLAAVGFALWASHATTLSLGSQWVSIVIAGAGTGLMLGPANTDAINRAPRLSYGEATGITQTVRNYGASLGLAILGTILLSVERSRLTSSLTSRGVPESSASHLANTISQSKGTANVPASLLQTPLGERIHAAAQAGFADATQVVLYVMCGIMAAAGAVALFGLRRGLQEATDDQGAVSPAGTVGTGGPIGTVGGESPAQA
jgi:EmrB/QacA subfamily drug resistance transporter